MSAVGAGGALVRDDRWRERALREVALASARGELDEAGLAALVATHVGELLGSVTSAVIREDPDCLAVIGYAGPTPYPQRLPKDEPSSSVQAVRSGRIARVDQYGPPGRPVGSFIAAQHLSCGISVPVLIDDRIWGCITVTTRRPSGFSSDEEQWLESFADLISAALANAQARKDLRFRARLEETLREVAVASASGAHDIHALGQLVAERVSELLHAPSAALTRFEPDRLTVLGRAGSAPVPAEVPLDIPSAAKLVAERGETVVIDDYAQIGGPYLELAERYDGKGAVAVPVFVAGRLWGSLGAMSPRDGFRPGAVELLERLAQLISAALANTEAQAQLRLSEERYRMVTTVSSDGVSDLDIRTGELWWSPQLLDKLGYDEQTFGGTYDWVHEQVVHPQDRSRLAVMLIGGEDYPTTLLRMRDTTGSYHTMVMRSALERDENGNVVRRVSSFTDVTEREAAEASRVAFAHELHDSVVENLASTRAQVAHARTMVRRDPAALEQRLDALIAQVAAAEQTIRLVSRALRFDTTLLEPRGSISAFTDTLAAELRHRDRRLDVVVENMLSAETQAKPAATAACAHVLREALLNVIQHADANRVSIKAACHEGRIRLEVSDDGNGFDPTHPSALLYHTRLEERVRAADGSLELFSAPGQGTRIAVELPEHVPAPPPNAALRVRGVA